MSTTPGAQRSRQELSARAAVAVSVLAVGAATLARRGSAPPHAFCLACGDAWLADAIMNTLLFVPLGVALAACGRTPGRVTAIGATLSCLIEMAQYLSMRGRFASPLDVLTNTLGALAGALAWQAALAWWQGRESSRPRTAVIAAWWLACLVAAWGLQPFAPAATYEGQWARQFPGFAPFGGQVADISLGNLPIGDGLVQASSRIPDEVATSGVQFVIRGSGLYPATPIAQVGGLVHGPGRLASVSLAGCRLQGRVGTNAERIGLHAPRIAVEDACDTTAAPFRIALAQDGRRFALNVDAAGQRSTAMTLRPVLAWALLAPLVTTDRSRESFTIAWIAAFGLVAGLSAGRPGVGASRRTAVVAATLLLGTILPALLFRSALPRPAELLLLAAATAVGSTVARISAPAPRTTPSARP